MKRLIFAIGVVSLLSACAPRLAQMPELPQPPERLVMYGYSFMPLDEKGWHVGGRSGNRLVLGKFGATPDETIVILSGNAYTQPFRSRDAFEQFIREKIANDAGSDDRFLVQRNDLSMIRHQGSDCALAHMTSVDRQARTRTGKKRNMILEVEQIYCMHPDDKGIVTYLGYSQRYDPGKRDPDFDARAQRLIDSLKLTNF